MKDVDLITREYRSKSDLFLLPLTGLPKNSDIKSYMFWEDYSIDNFQLILEIKNMLNKIPDIIQILDKNAPIIECYEDNKVMYFVVDLSEWALDIELILAGKYSKMSKAAKKTCENFHSLHGRNPIRASIYGIMYPNTELEVLGNKTPLEYLVTHYKIDEETVMKIGEIGSLYDKMAETLSKKLERNKICQI